MNVQGKYIYWLEQCDYCKNRKNCEYYDNMQTYLASLNNIPSKVYGTLTFKCDYLSLDEKLYWEKNMGENKLSV